MISQIPIDLILSKNDPEVLTTPFSILFETSLTTSAVFVETLSTTGGTTSAALSTTLSNPVFVGFTSGIASLLPVAEPLLT